MTAPARAWGMDASHPVAAYLGMFFGDEPDDRIAVLSLSRQLGRQPTLARDLRDAWRLELQRRDAESARALVEDFANRDVGGSGSAALDWLTTMYARLEPLWSSLSR